MFRIALVGCGAVADWHWERGFEALLKSAPDTLRLVAACDSREDRLDPFVERAQGAMPDVEVKGYRSYEDLLADTEIDGVDICTPHRAHHQMALQALAAGKHVLVEKPIADTVAGAEEMVRAARDAGLTLCVNENYPFSEPFLRARRLIRDRRLGKIVLARSHRVGYLGGIWLRDGWRNRAELAGGGMLLDQGCHYTKILRHLVRDVPEGGEITHLHAYATTNRDDWSGEDTAVLNLRFAGGLLGQQTYCWATRTTNVGAEAYVYGEQGHLEVNSQAPTFTLFHRDAENGREVVMDQRPDYSDTFARSIEDFALSATGLKHPTMPGTDGLIDLRVVEAAYRSVKSGREEAV